MTIEIKCVIDGGTCPTYATAGSVGCDLTSCEDVTLYPGSRVLVRTGLRIAIPDGYEGQVRPRSGLALKHGVTVLNTPGTIDSDYRGEVKVVLVNFGHEKFAVKKGDKVAQLVLSPVAHASFVVVESLSDTCRGDGGFGSTGA